MRKAGDIISALFKERFGNEFAEAARSHANLFSSWVQVVTEVWSHGYRNKEDSGPPDAPAAAVHSRIRELERGVLLVEADHPGWIQLLQTKQAELLSAIQRRYPKLGVRGMAFRLSRKPFSSHDPEEREPVDVKTPVEVKTSYGDQDAQKDEEFYAALKGLGESVKKRNSLLKKSVFPIK